MHASSTPLAEPMPKITALLHTHNDGLRLGRTLDSLRPCDEVLIIDDSSEDDTERIAHENGAHIKSSIPGVSQGAYAMDASNDWILCMLPNEALSEELEASLQEWKNQEQAETLSCCKVRIREQNGSGWHELDPEVRLINRKLMNWVGDLPPEQHCDITLSGDLLRFQQP
jgi:glycosyltransferase involved in cell wall biosynthesis